MAIAEKIDYRAELEEYRGFLARRVRIPQHRLDRDRS